MSEFLYWLGPVWPDCKFLATIFYKEAKIFDNF